jgi:hypothetical protein
MDIILNELSLQPLPINSSHATILMNAWLAQLIEIAATRRVKLAFRGLSSVGDMQIAADGTVFKQWLERLHREERQRALAFVAQTPFIHRYPEYRFDALEPAGMQGKECMGLAFAAENNLLAWSLDPLGHWTAAHYQLHCTSIDEERDVTDEYELDAWHLPASGETSEHVAYYAGMLAAEELQLVQAAISGKILLQRWAEWFPTLQLTETARESLAELTTEAARPVTERLVALERFFRNWDQKPVNYDHVLSYKTSQESDSRMQQFTELQLSCPDGKTRAMSWHVRYTPQAGRLYFVPDTETRNCYIGYIGHKIV